MSATTRPLYASALAALLAAGCLSPAPEPVDPTTPETPTPVEPTDPPTDSQTVVMPNGMKTFVTKGPAGSSVQAQFGVMAGSLFEAPGLAELAAEVLLRSADPTRGQQSLAERIAAIGGTIEIRIGLMATWFDVRVPANKFKQALIALRESLESMTQSRHQIERIRDDLVERRASAMLGDPIEAMCQATLLAEPSTSASLNGLLDLDPSQVRLLHSKLYRPETSQLSVSYPAPPDRIVKRLQDNADKGMAGWAPPAAIPGEISLLSRRFESKLLWCERGNAGTRAAVAMVLPLPNPTEQHAAELLVIHSCLTLDGTGGRFERLQDEAGLGHLEWRARYLQHPGSHALVLTTTATPAEAARLWHVMENARKSLIDVPPSRSEVQLGLRRARLNAGLARLDQHANLRTTATLSIAGLPLDVLETKLTELERKPTNYSQVAKLYESRPHWMIVFGPDRAAASETVPFDLLPKGYRINDGEADDEQPKASTSPWLSRAMAACGPPAEFPRILGFDASSTQSTALAPETDDTTTWRIDGTLTRDRKVLDTIITTSLSGDTLIERIDKTQKSLTPNEAGTLRRQAQRHPLMLLSAHARGALQFRTIAQRDTGDRSMMVMEALGEQFDRLRIHIDTESHLIRIVESWDRVDGALVHIHETWSDYRNAGKLRAPMRRDSSWNDGEHSHRTTFTSFSLVHE